jgi:hypothetical protein
MSNDKRASRSRLGQRVVVVVDRREVWATIETLGHIGYFVRLDDGARVWRHTHEVYDGMSE